MLHEGLSQEDIVQEGAIGDEVVKNPYAGYQTLLDELTQRCVVTPREAAHVGRVLDILQEEGGVPGMTVVNDRLGLPVLVGEEVFRGSLSGDPVLRHHRLAFGRSGPFDLVYKGGAKRVDGRAYIMGGASSVTPDQVVNCMDNNPIGGVADVVVVPNARIPGSTERWTFRLQPVDEQDVTRYIRRHRGKR